MREAPEPAGLEPPRPAGIPGAADRRRALLRVALAALASRALVLAGAWAGALHPRPDLARATAHADRYAHVARPLLEAAARWDASFYLWIAARGYEPVAAAGTDALLQAAFFPLYPLLVRGAAGATGLSLLAAAVVVSWLAFAAAVAVAFLAFEEVAGTARAEGATTLVVLFFASVFFSAVYTESLFLFLSAGALLLARRRHLVAAGLLAALATLTRPNGLWLVVPLALEALEHARERGHAPDRPQAAALAGPAVLGLALPFAALALHARTLGIVYGDPLAFAHVQAVWGRRLSPPWHALLAFGFDPEYYVVALGGLAAIAAAWRQRQPASWQAWGAMSLLVPMCTGTLKSLPRFASVAFPLFLTVDGWLLGRRRTRLAVLSASAVLLAVYAYRFARGDAIN